ncbi:hypothetical protein [Sulfitobacter sediminilitoris]|uniref:hypothetical protein n=1 Tax=Sulfitobacter sediminilitoris TaxID=2698830 RepID=UPI00360E4CFA
MVGFILRKLWQRLTRQDTRFGAAAVAFGQPLSLRNETEHHAVDGLLEELMSRIETVMPVPIVPVIAHVLLEADGITDAKLLEKAATVLSEVPEGNRVIKLENLKQEMSRALKGLKARELITESGDIWRIASDHRPVLQFYANSIAHFFEEDDAAVAK